MARFPSLELIAEAVATDQAAQLRHFESLDTKAGIVLGFAGVLVALGTGSQAELGIVALIVGAAAALFALLAFVPRSYPVLELRKTRDRYLPSDPRFTKLHVIDTRIAIVEETSRLLMRKARWLKAAILMLALATGISVVDALLR